MPPADKQAAASILAARVREYIDEGGFAPGDRLPAERVLTERLGMSRSELRKALGALEQVGVLWRHVGKGTFLADHDPPDNAGTLQSLGARLTPFRMMRARLAIEPAIAREAAINATGEHIARIRLTIARTRAASTWAEYEAQDDVLHRQIAAASDNLLLEALFDQLNAVRRAVAWGNVVRSTAEPPENHDSFAEHEAIARAIEGRDPAAAQEAMRRHLRSVSDRLFGKD